VNQMGSGSRITKEVKDVIYRVWKADQDRLAKEPGKKLNVKKLLDDVNAEIRRKQLRMDVISKSQLYVEIKALMSKKEEIELKHPFLDKPFDLGTFVHEYGKEAVVDGDGIRAIIAWQALVKELNLGIGTNRQALWVTRLSNIIHWQSDEHNEGNEERITVRNTEIASEEDVIISTQSWIVTLATVHIVSLTYALTELYSEITGQSLDTSTLDNALTEAQMVPFFEKTLTVLTNDKKYGAYIEAIKRKIKKESGGTK
jgi:hypothetical protein